VSIACPAPASSPTPLSSAGGSATGAGRTLYQGIIGGHYFVADLARASYARATAIDEQFADLGLGFVDSAIVALSESMKVKRIATTNRRHFDPLAGRFSLEIVP